MYRFIWLVPLLPLVGAAVNGILGLKFRFAEQLIGGIAVGSVALSFLITVLAVYSYGFGNNSVWPNPYLTEVKFTWIAGGAVNQTLGGMERASIAANEEAKEKLAQIPPEERTNPQAVAVAVVEKPRSSVLNVEWSYQLDPLSSVFMLIVTGVGLCIFVFATG